MALNLIGSDGNAFGYAGTAFGVSATYPAYTAATTRSLFFDAGAQQYAHLTVPGKGTALDLANWEIELRMKFLVTPAGGVYLLHRGNLGDEFALIAGFAGTALTYWSFNDNTAQGVVSVTIGELGVGVYHTVRLVYTNGLLTTYLDGLQTNMAMVAAPEGEEGRPLTLARMSRAMADGYYASFAIDWLRITKNGQLIVNAGFNEEAGPALNTGAAGGSFQLLNGPVRA